MASTVTGIADVTRKLQRFAAQFPDELKSALRSELEIESTESQRRTPVDTGALRQSHRVEVKDDGDDIVGTITVGGPAAPYAVDVHERLDVFHPVGQAKFLESTLAESKAHLANRVAKRIGVERLVK